MHIWKAPPKRGSGFRLKSDREAVCPARLVPFEQGEIGLELFRAACDMMLEGFPRRTVLSGHLAIAKAETRLEVEGRLGEGNLWLLYGNAQTFPFEHPTRTGGIGRGIAG